MDIYTVIKRIIGNIEPYGDTDIDETRIDNLKNHIDVTFSLIEDLIKVAKHKDRYEASIKDMGNLAYNELLEIKKMIDSELERN